MKRTSLFSLLSKSYPWGGSSWYPAHRCFSQRCYRREKEKGGSSSASCFSYYFSLSCFTFLHRSTTTATQVFSPYGQGQGGVWFRFPLTRCSQRYANKVGNPISFVLTSTVFFSSFSSTSTTPAPTAGDGDDGHAHPSKGDSEVPSSAQADATVSSPLDHRFPPPFSGIPTSFPPTTLSSRALLRLTGEEEEVLDFLQGLVTCDMRRLSSASSSSSSSSLLALSSRTTPRTNTESIWGCFLELNGRVIADAYFYKQRPPSPSHDSPSTSTTIITSASCRPILLWLEVEKGLHASLVLEHLQDMRMRRKVVIEDVSDKYAVVAEYKMEVQGPTAMEKTTRTSSSAAAAAAAATRRDGEGSTKGEEGSTHLASPVKEAAASFPMPSPLSLSTSDPETEVETEGSSSSSSSSSLCISHAICSVEDPRSPFIFSTLPPKIKNASGSPSSHGDDDHAEAQKESRSTPSPPRRRRVLVKHFIPIAWCPPLTASDPYSLVLAAHGVGEGAEVFISHKSLPFDGNADLLAGGIAFDKGCYIGQELTHRTHVMLVVRKRLLPIMWRNKIEKDEEKIDTATTATPSLLENPQSPSKSNFSSTRKTTTTTTTTTATRLDRRGQALIAKGKPSGKLLGLPFPTLSSVPTFTPGSRDHPGEKTMGMMTRSKTEVDEVGLSGGRSSTSAGEEERKGRRNDNRPNNHNNGDEIFYGVALVRLQHVDPATHSTMGITFQDGTPVLGALPEWWSRKEIKKMFRKLKEEQK